ncbi:hypothetical protein IQ225_14030 [Synechocystis salina LEGE 06155]|nr:hypothetical protein [Synechocystis salina LEGE 06155]
MNLKIPKEQDVVEEALLILEQKLPPSKLALLLSRWQSDQGDYLKMRDELFKSETVESLATDILEFEAQRASSQQAET